MFVIIEMNMLENKSSIHNCCKSWRFETLTVVDETNIAKFNKKEAPSFDDSNRGCELS
jgi:hypothetical protein